MYFVSDVSCILSNITVYAYSNPSDMLQHINKISSVYFTTSPPLKNYHRGRLLSDFTINHDLTLCNQPTRSTQPSIPPGSLNRVPASAGVREGMTLLSGGR